MHQPASLGGGQWGAKAVLFAIRQTLDQMISAQRQNPSSPCSRVRAHATRWNALATFIKSKSRSLCVCAVLMASSSNRKHAHQTIDLNLLRRVCSTGRVIYLEIIIHDRATICVCAVHFMIISFLESSARKSLTCILKCRLQMHFVMKSASKHRVLIGHLIQFLRLSWLCRQQQTTILMATLNYYL
jgi:hypothetical protein